MNVLDVACPLCGAPAGEPCLNLRRLYAFNPNRLMDQPKTIQRPHLGRKQAAQQRQEES